MATTIGREFPPAPKPKPEDKKPPADKADKKEQ